MVVVVVVVEMVVMVVILVMVKIVLQENKDLIVGQFVEVVGWEEKISVELSIAIAVAS